MSDIIWKNKITPPAEEPVKTFQSEFLSAAPVAHTRAIPQDVNDLVKLPDRRAYRSMSRAAVLLSAAALPAKDVLAPFLAKSPYSVGIYCAIEQGTTDYATCRQMESIPLSAPEFSDTYRKLRSPKMFLRQLPNLAPAQLGIFLDARGPLNVYIHSKFACQHALEQAEFDLQNGIVEAALVCSAFSFEDPILLARTRRDNPEGVINEGAAALVLTRGNAKSQWNHISGKKVPENFGITTDLMNLI